MLKLQSISRSFPCGEITIQAASDISLTIGAGEFVCLAGPSGSGKSSLLNILGLLDRPTSGEFFLDGAATSAMDDKERARQRLSRIGFVFQAFNLIPVLTVFENIEYPLALQKVGAAERAERIEAVLNKVGLAHYKKKTPRTLSGGEQQRVAIARALVGSPRLVIADEPTANLDSNTGVKIIELMQDLNSREGVTFIIASHDEKIIQRAPRVVRMVDGRLDS